MYHRVITVLLGLLIVTSAHDNGEPREVRIVGIFEVEAVARNPKDNRAAGYKGQVWFLRGGWSVVQTGTGTPARAIMRDEWRSSDGRRGTVDIMVAFGSLLEMAKKEQKLLGIYERKGDSLRICLSPAGKKTRPTGFDIARQRGCTLVTLRKKN